MMMKQFLMLFLLLFAFNARAECDPPKFSPNGGIEAMVVDFVGSASESVHVLAYNFTSQPIAQALISAQKRGVDVRVIVDKSVPTERGSVLPTLRAAGVPVLIDRAHSIAHNKVIVVDGLHVETGSFNYTTNAERFNAENAMICHGAILVGYYLDDWHKHEGHSK